MALSNLFHVIASFSTLFAWNMPDIDDGSPCLDV
jgi:hypothetical protein